MAPSIKLVVEVDGACHARRAVADARREQFLRRLGYTIVRLNAALVTAHLPHAIDQVRRAIQR